MAGYILAALLLGGGYYVWHFNETHATTYLLIPLLDNVPALRGDIEAQAEWSWRIVVGLGIFVLVATVVGQVRRATRRRDEPDEE
jgi:hypothetical protein